jgi:hypothetical protein
MHTGEWGLCGPRANHTPELGGTGGAALGGAGYVSGPNGNLLLSSTPRIYWNLANTQTGDIDKTYATGPSFAKNDGWGISLQADWSLSDNMTIRSITGFGKPFSALRCSMLIIPMLFAIHTDKSEILAPYAILILPVASFVLLSGRIIGSLEFVVPYVVSIALAWRLASGMQLEARRLPA